MRQYKQRQRQVDAVQFTGGNLADFRKLVPPEVATFERVVEHEPVLAMLVMLAPGREPRLLHKGDWVSWDGKYAIAHGEKAFAAAFEPA